jgi:hypothetical protein
MDAKHDFKSAFKRHVHDCFVYDRSPVTAETGLKGKRVLARFPFV